MRRFMRMQTDCWRAKRMPEYTVEFHRAAKQDIAAAYRYIAHNLCAPQAAKKWLQSIEAAVEAIQRFPLVSGAIAISIPYTYVKYVHFLKI